MRFTPDQVIAFGDWLECAGIRRALVAARPELADAVALDPQRPLLRISHAQGTVVVARLGEGEPSAWMVGRSAAPTPVLHEAGTAESAAALVLELLDRPVPAGAQGQDDARS